MTHAQRMLTPTADRTPAVVEIDNRRPSGASWCRDFPGSTLFDSNMAEPFSSNAQAFIAALRAAGAVVSVASTYRPPERAFLMHWSWKIVNANADPQAIPARQGVNIRWDHRDDTGVYSSEKSIAAAKAMVNGYAIHRLKVAPALSSRHTEGNAVDMTIHWSDNLVIKRKDATEVTIATEPRTGMNTTLHEVGATYGVTKYHGGDKDKPHWSNDGR